MTAMGMGLGPAGPMVSISVQNAVDMRDLGTATSLNSFFRSMGGSFGVAIMGAILFAGLSGQGAGTPGISASGLLHGGPAVIASLPEHVRAAIVASFGHSFRYVYMVGAGDLPPRRLPRDLHEGIAAEALGPVAGAKRGSRKPRASHRGSADPAATDRSAGRRIEAVANGALS